MYTIVTNMMFNFNDQNYTDGYHDKNGKHAIGSIIKINALLLRRRQSTALELKLMLYYLNVVNQPQKQKNYHGNFLNMLNSLI